MTHGGKREGAGRPPKPSRERRNQRLVVLLTAAELRAVERNAAAAGTTVPEWVRLMLTQRVK